MEIKRTEPPTGTENRTKREEIVPLLTTPATANAEPENYGDASESEGWSWDSDPSICTWNVQTAAMRGSIAPFAALDIKGDGVFTYWFSDQYLPIDGDGGEDDMSPDNFDQKLARLMARYPRNFHGGRPVAGGTDPLAAITRADKRFLKEFPDPTARPPRIRTIHTDGLLQPAVAAEFRRYLSASRPSSTEPTLGTHGEGDHHWEEAWAVIIYGERGGGGQKAHEQYQEVSKDHPWVHPYYFEGVKNGDEIAEDVAVATVPVHA